MNDDKNSKINEVTEKADIVNIISNYIELKKAGKDYVGICPFHNDHDPSLHVTPQLKLFNCFVCHTKGNVIHFVSKYENISFGEALRKVAANCGVEIKSNASSYELKREKYLKIMNDATNLYESYLNLSTQGKEALEYLHNRKITDDVIKKFRIGLSNSDGTLITKTFLDEGKYLPIDLIGCGLINNDNNNKDRYYDLFRNRIMIPILDYRGNVIGFSGRIYKSNNKSDPKYVNSREGFLFKKSNVLYNYSNAVNEIKTKDSIYIFEGFMDVYAAYRAGVENCVCAMGTAFTEEHVKMITKLTKNIILCFDGDTPGINSSKRTIKMFQKENVSIRNVILPYGLDPDDYINKYGGEALKDLLLNKTVSSVDYLYEMERRKLNIEDNTSIQAFIRGINDIFELFNSSIINEKYIKKVAEELGVDVESIKNEFSKIQKKTPSNNYEDYGDVPNDYYYPPFNEDDIPPENYGDYNYPTDNLNDIPNVEVDTKAVKKGARIIRKYEKAEERLVYIALLDKTKANQIRRRLDDGEYVIKTNRNILYKIYNYYSKNDEMILDDFYQMLNEEEIDKVNQIRSTLDNVYKVNSDDDSSIDKLYEGMDSNIDCVKQVKYQKSLIDYDKTTLDNVEKKISAKRKLIVVKKKVDPLGGK